MGGDFAAAVGRMLASVCPSNAPKETLKYSSLRRKPGPGSLNFLDSGVRRNDESAIIQRLPNWIEAARPAQPSPEQRRRDRKLIEAGARIAIDPPRGEDMAFTHSVFCQVGLPRSRVAGERFMRQSGSAWINVQAGFLDEGNGPVLQPVPYGAMPRLALAWVSTFAKRHKTREVPIGDSASAFLRLIGKPTAGGKRGAFNTLRTQMHALAACRLQLGYKGRTYNDLPVERFDAWIADKDNNQKALWPGVMLLSESYFSELMTNGVPLDNRALLALGESALALDAYCWLAHRLHRIEGRPAILHWKSLREQFAQEYQGRNPDKDFKRRFLPALQAALAVYPQAKVKQVTGGVMLLPSPPPIPFRGG